MKRILLFSILTVLPLLSGCTLTDMTESSSSQAHRTFSVELITSPQPSVSSEAVSFNEDEQRDSKIRVKVSSRYSKDYSGDNMLPGNDGIWMTMDGDLTTAHIKYTFDKPITISRIHISNGNESGEITEKKYGKIGAFELSFDDGSTVSLSAPDDSGYLEYTGEFEPVTTRFVTLKVNKIFTGEQSGSIAVDTLEYS